jgi:two-component system, LytTR family, sensor kinase
LSEDRAGLPPPGFLPGPRTAVIVLMGTTAVALLSFWYRYLDVLTRGREEPFQITLIEEMTGVFGAVFLLVPVVWFTRNLRWRGVPGWIQVPFHLPVVIGFAALHTSLNWVTRVALFPLAGLGPYDYGAMPHRYAMELGIQVPLYLLCVGGALVAEHLREGRERDLRVARLEGELARAQVTNLEHRLRPHFLFNALNTVSSVMYDDRDRADRILADLALLLRRSLPASEAQEVPLAEEVENLELFLGIARARFEERLEVRVEVAEEALGVPIPVLLLQPLVENALRHGDPGEDRTLRVRVAAAVLDGRLAMEVSDNGPGADAPLEELAEQGVGLGTTLRRLQLLYPGAHRFSGENLPEGGYRVRVELPASGGDQ